MRKSDVVVAGVCCLLLVAGFAVGFKSPSETSPVPDVTPDSVVIFETDSGSATAEKFFRLYAGYCAAAVDGIASKAESGEADSLAIAQEWQALTKAAREEASKGLDARVTALLKSSLTNKEKADWIRESKSGFLRVANGYRSE